MNYRKVISELPRVALEPMSFETTGCDARLLGGLYMGGAYFHVEAIRVVTKPVRSRVFTSGETVDWDMQIAWHELHQPGDGEPHCDCEDRLGTMYVLDPEEPFVTVEIPGFEGDYVLLGTIGK